MAIRKNSSLGHITGKLENTVTRCRYGKYVVYKKPSEINYSRSDAALSARSKFALTVKLAKLINSNKELNTVWKYSKLKGVNAYQKLIKHNSASISSDGLSSNCIITPEGFHMNNSWLQYDSDQLVVKTKIEFPSSKNLISFFLLIYLYNSTGRELILLSSNVVESTEDGFVIGTVLPSAEEKNIIEKYNDAIVYASFTFSKSNNKEIYWSSTQSFPVHQEAK